jgi:hypothetical protein
VTTQAPLYDRRSELRRAWLVHLGRMSPAEQVQRDGALERGEVTEPEELPPGWLWHESGVALYQPGRTRWGKLSAQQERAVQLGFHPGSRQPVGSDPESRCATCIHCAHHRPGARKSWRKCRLWKLGGGYAATDIKAGWRGCVRWEPTADSSPPPVAASGPPSAPHAPDE